jgi:hypothetical protein
MICRTGRQRGTKGSPATPTMPLQLVRPLVALVFLYNLAKSVRVVYVCDCTQLISSAASREEIDKEDTLLQNEAAQSRSMFSLLPEEVRLEIFGYLQPAEYVDTAETNLED